jgi:hypothetical protein
MSVSTAIDVAFFVRFVGASHSRFPRAVQGIGSGSGKWRYVGLENCQNEADG